jgi:phospholipid/cholesterol/gamma-HCH transport system ATP-binding protein
MLRAVALIEFHDVKKAFGPKVVYRELNLEVKSGETLTIIGGSGVGKSVMLKMLIGLIPIDEGAIFFEGAPIAHLSERAYNDVRRKIAYLFQGAALFDSLDVEDNVAYGLRNLGTFDEATIEQRVTESLASVGLPETRKAWPADLSGGMKKRVGLARCIALRPRVILYDEPTTGLDPVNVVRINNLITHLKESLNVTSLVVTHDLSTMFSVSDRIAMIHDGRIIFVGTPEELRASPDARVRDFVEGNAPEHEDTATLLRSAG